MGFGKRTIPLFLAILALVILIAWVKRESAPEQNAEPARSPLPQVTEAPKPAGPSPAVSLKAETSNSLELPSLREVREQVAQDPHHTPPALLQFAKELSTQAEVAKKSEGSAKIFFEKLEDCMQTGKEQGDSVPVAAQTVCLTTAEEFAKLYPAELGSRYSTLQKNAPPEVKRIRDALNRL